MTGAWPDAWIACSNCTKASSGNCNPARSRTMSVAARMPPGNRSPTLPTIALAFLAGAGACLLLPRLPSWPWLAGLLLVGPGVGWFLRHARPGLRLAAPWLLGFGLAGVHAAVTLSRQLPQRLEQRD